MNVDEDTEQHLELQQRWIHQHRRLLDDICDKQQNLACCSVGCL